MCEVCNYEDNRGKMIIICPVCLTNNKLAERKQGALEELYKLSYYCDKAQVDERAIKRMILKRIKELEGVEK